MFEYQIQLAQWWNVPIVVHLREKVKANDQREGKLVKLALEMLKKLGPDHPIHWHCFSFNHDGKFKFVYILMLF